MLIGGQGGIRTHGELAPTAVFKTAALNHSATCPRCERASGDRRGCHPRTAAGNGMTAGDFAFGHVFNAVRVCKDTEDDGDQPLSA